MKKNTEKSIEIERSEAARRVLHAQGLTGKSFGGGKVGALKTINQLGYIQLDTLAVVARAHHHTIYTRTRAYTENQLAQLLHERKIFEYWSHAASYLSMEDFRFSLVRKSLYRNKDKAHWFAKNQKIMQYVLDRIRAEGALQSSDFETDRKRGSWFDWKPAKVALEQLFMDGTLMVAERKGFQKVYDLTERIVPNTIDTRMPDTHAYARYLITKTLQAQGMATLREITYLRKHAVKDTTEVLQTMIESGEVMRITIAGVKNDYVALANEFAQKLAPIAQNVHILSPFDNVLIQRNRGKQIFGYDYQVECYVPEPRRRFGYFCLPILFGDQFIGRFDPKADRAMGVFTVKNIFLEHAPKDKPIFLDAFVESLRNFAHFNGCHTINIAQAESAALKREIKKRL
ncbi:MAG: winged helix-turn-helix domain-containing protein [Bacteroidia bacterium]